MSQGRDILYLRLYGCDHTIYEIDIYYFGYSFHEFSGPGFKPPSGI